ncbi:MAG TPA: hypothetical protein VHR55_13215 [Candidatus Limnocylindria bacterium]|nr:hypothetical protein [Candidatus Limnocylindria bacterium]
MEGRSARLAPATLLLAVLVALAGCAGVGPGGSTAPSASAEPTVEVSIRIGPDGPELPEDAVAALQAYGADHADEFGGMWVEDQAHGAFVMLFTGHLEEHAAAVAEIWPRVAVRQARYAEADLVALLEGLDFEAMAADGIELVSASLDTMNNRVTLDVKSNDPTLEVRLELEYSGMVDVTVYPVPGEWSNVAEGPGWRLLAAGVSESDAYTVRAATDADEWAAMWDAIGLDGAPPVVDFATEVAVSFGHGIGSSCPELRLDGVEIGGGVVFSRVSDPLAPRGCTDDLIGGAVFVVAVDRDALPDDGFSLQLFEDRMPCRDCGLADQLDVELP